MFAVEGKVLGAVLAGRAIMVMNMYAKRMVVER
jgi:hypothetical protein